MHDLHAHADAASATYTDDEETSVIEEESDADDHDDYIDDDGSSSLSIPNESIDFDLVYSLHSFAATVEGQANVVKGDSLFLMDDSNSYWWLVRVLKTQEVGYIPAENIETPFERLARLNKHRNVDLASPTQAELNENIHAPSTESPSPLPLGVPGQPHARTIRFGGPRFGVLRYPRAIWRDDDFMDVDPADDDSDWIELSEHEDAGLAEEQSDDPGDQDVWQDAPPLDPPQPLPVPPALQPGLARPVQSPVPVQPQDHQEPLYPVDPPPLHEQEPHRTIDPAEATETRKLTMTPTIARSEENRPSLDPQQQEEARKPVAHLKAKMAPPVSSASLSKNTGGKLRKERESDDESGSGKDKKKRSLIDRILRKKDKEKNSSAGSSESGDSLSRLSDDSLRASANRPSTSDPILSPTTATAMQQQQQQALNTLRAAVVEPQAQAQTPAVSQHASQLRQRDQQQQALYTQQYLNRSPSSPPEAQPSYGLQSASALSAYHSPPGAGSALGPPPQRPRPGSLILTQSVVDAGGPVTELSVIRVFAGKNLQTEATFKTVLLNSGTTSEELIKQATQRFRLSIGDGEGGEYYLTVKQVEGGAFAVLRPEEKPLVVFEHLVEEAMEMPKVKRSSVGSISSVASNLSMHPAIRKLAMNDFTDDSAVKFYLNRRDGSVLGHDYDDEGDDTLIADSSYGADDSLEAPSLHPHPHPPPPPRLAVSLAATHNVTPERFTSPSVRFALQLVIYPEDLPEDMVFHPQTEAIVFRDTLRGADAAALAVSVSPHMRRKVFVFPKNATVAEVIELGLERFGISEGVVDGGDEIEDKSMKRRSSTRVRYALFVAIAGSSSEKELTPAGRVIEAFPRPPALKAAERHTQTSSNKRRSVDSSFVLGTMDDVGADDPVFILRRAMTYRSSSARHRMSAPLDELALHHLHRDSTSSVGTADAPAPAPAPAPAHGHGHGQDAKLSRQEIIARQRDASRATQRAILSAQTNSYRGMDVLLPGNTMLRSSRYDAAGHMRYSYVDGDGGEYDVSDIVEQELRDAAGAGGAGVAAGAGVGAGGSAPQRSDLLEGVLGRRDVVGEKLNRVLSKIRSGRVGVGVGVGEKERERERVDTEEETETEGGDARRSRSISEYSVDTTASEVPPLARSTSPLCMGGTKSRTPTMEVSPALAVGPAERPRPGTSTPTQPPAGNDRRQLSIASVMSDVSGYATPPPVRSVEVVGGDGGGGEDGPMSASAVLTPRPSPPLVSSPSPSPSLAQSQSHAQQQQQRRLVIPQDEFGIAHMLSIIEYKDARPKTQLPPLDPVDALLFGRPFDLQALHPRIREVYAPTFKQLEEMDKILDDYLGHVLVDTPPARQ